MKNGIIIDGKQYEVQKVDKKLKDTDLECDLCDLKEECDALGRNAMCVILHGVGCDYAYKCIEKTNDNGKEQNQD